MTLDIYENLHTTLCHHAECHYAESCVRFITMLNVFMLSVVMLSVVTPFWSVQNSFRMDRKLDEGVLALTTITA